MTRKCILVYSVYICVSINIPGDMFVILFPIFSFYFLVMFRSIEIYLLSVCCYTLSNLGNRLPVFAYECADSVCGYNVHLSRCRYYLCLWLYVLIIVLFPFFSFLFLAVLFFEIFYTILNRGTDLRVSPAT